METKLSETTGKYWKLHIPKWNTLWRMFKSKISISDSVQQSLFHVRCKYKIAKKTLIHMQSCCCSFFLHMCTFQYLQTDVAYSHYNLSFKLIKVINIFNLCFIDSLFFSHSKSNHFHLLNTYIQIHHTSSIYCLIYIKKWKFSSNSAVILLWFGFTLSQNNCLGIKIDQFECPIEG